MRALGSGGKAHDVAGLEHVLAAGMANARRAAHDKEPLLLGVLVVVGTNRLTLGQLVKRGAELVAADLRAETVEGDAKALGRVVVIVDVRSGLMKLARLSGMRRGRARGPGTYPSA